MQEDDRCRPPIHVPNPNVRAPVRVRTPWEVRFQQPHLLAEQRLSGYPDGNREHHHAAEERVKYIGFLTRSSVTQQDAYGLEVEE